jgi:sortase A
MVPRATEDEPVSRIELFQPEHRVADASGVSSVEAPRTQNATSQLRRRGLSPWGTFATVLWVSATFTGLALWFVFHALVLTPLQEHGSQARLYAQFREQLANATAPLGGVIKPGSPVALIDTRIKGLHDLVVVEGTAAGQLTLGPGHLSDTPLPGQAGISLLFGRSVTYGAPFRDISRLQAEDAITVTTGQGVFTYRVDRIRLPGDPLPVLSATDGARLTLVTSAASGWRSGWAPDHMIYLDATLVGSQALPAPAGRPTAVMKSALPMHGDMGGLVPFVFWLEALLLVSGGLAWAWMRWGGWQTWLAGLPLVLAVLWGASGAAARLLPNLI